MLTRDELRKVQRCEEKSEEINNELEFKKEKVEWNNLIILKNKVKELNEIEKRLEELNKKRRKLNNKIRIFAEIRLISGGGCQYTYQREGG